MTTNQRRQPVLTLGDFIMQVYDACEEKAAVIVWFAIKSNLVRLSPGRLRPVGARKRAMDETPIAKPARPLLKSSARLPKPTPHFKHPLRPAGLTLR